MDGLITDKCLKAKTVNLDIKHEVIELTSMMLATWVKTRGVALLKLK